MPAALEPGPSGYEKYRDQQAGISRARSAKGREIGGIPDIEDPERRERCERNLKLFCETYNPAPLYFGWSEDHLKAIARIEEAATLGALYAFAFARGSGKTVLCRMAALWVLSYAIRRYPFLIGATDEKSRETLDTIRMLIRFLPEYAADFPEISWPAICLAGIANRATGQTCNGESTLIEWSADRIVLPTVPPPSNWPKHWRLRSDGMVPTSGVLVSASGLTGEGIRGSLKTLTTGEMVRPDFVLLDDPQTPESARSLTQNANRLKLVSADVLGMAGPGKGIAAVMPCTVIEVGDMVDEVLDRSKHPLWRGERTGMLRSMPTNLPAWEAYFDVYARCAQMEPPDFTESNAHYVANRGTLDAGAEASWPERKEPHEVSAIQSAMHLFFRDRRAFWAEYMNRPLSAELDLADDIRLEAGEISKKLNAVPRGVVPGNCTKLTAFIDVGENVMYYAIVGWADNFSGSVIDYGTCPRQRRAYFSNRDASPSLSDAFPKGDVTARIYAGLKATTEAIIPRAYPRQGGGELRIALCMIDTGHEGDTVYDFCRESRLTPFLMPHRGYGIGAKSNPMANWTPRQGETKGTNWRKTPTTGTGRGLHVISDVNWWKTFVAQRLMTPPGGVGRLTLFGTDPREHRLFADHLTAEHPEKTEGRGRELYEWSERPGKPDNHWFDCVVGCAIAASVLGVKWSAAGAMGEPVHTPGNRPTVKLSDLQRQKREAKKARR